MRLLIPISIYVLKALQSPKVKITHLTCLIHCIPNLPAAFFCITSSLSLHFVLIEIPKYQKHPTEAMFPRNTLGDSLTWPMEELTGKVGAERMMHSSIPQIILHWMVMVSDSESGHSGLRSTIFSQLLWHCRHVHSHSDF